MRAWNSVARDTSNQLFVSQARTYVQSLADELALSNTLHSLSRTVVQLDSVVLGWHGGYAAIDYTGRLLGRSLVETPADLRQRSDSRVLGASVDHAFSLSAPVGIRDTWRCSM